MKIGTILLWMKIWDMKDINGRSYVKPVLGIIHFSIQQLFSR